MTVTRPANTSPPADRGAGRGRLGVTMASSRLADRRQLQRLGQRRPGQHCRVRRVDKGTLSGERFVRKYCHYCIQSTFGRWDRTGAGGAGKGRNRAHPVHAKLPHAAHRVFQGLASPFCACSRSRSVRSVASRIEGMSQKPKFKDGPEKFKNSRKMQHYRRKRFSGNF